MIPFTILKSVILEPDSSFIISVVELKLNTDTMFEWQKDCQDKVEDVPCYQVLLDFIDLRAQASESSLFGLCKKNVPHLGKKPGLFGKPIPSFPAPANPSNNHCILCTAEYYSLYFCPKFKSLNNDYKLSTLRKNNICMNCLNGGQLCKHCRSFHKCKKCQHLHHTLLHVEPHNTTPPTSSTNPGPAGSSVQSQVISNMAAKLRSNSLLMTCRVLVTSAN